MEINNNKLPKRKAKKTFMSVTGYFPSKKNSRSIFFESMLEKKLFSRLFSFTKARIIFTICSKCIIPQEN